MTRLSGETALVLAWIIALISSLAVLFIGEVLGQTPCVLCWFQRAFMFPLAVVLGLGLWWQDPRVGRYGVALALGGAAVALYHIGLYVGLIPEAIQPCKATGPSCTDDNQVSSHSDSADALVAFTMIGVLSAISLKEKQT
ncbi:Disulphide bond formation protein DsbB [Roseovarius sp. TM1035]|uniref:disulfide bond formation protein B n=1 Tax=Roseovarius sp. TM1035 TaxID=391613 RepID=UPI000155787A|nr:disulfide bond formation protein B [Roseovarius sp. TM1035]EDM30153.1 Disulphide bond formation protein DsbB [Roseovarius sp. TM1035]